MTRYATLVRIFLRVGSRAYGGWTTTALLLEDILVDQHKLLTARQMKSAVTAAQLIPGATQLAIAAYTGYLLRRTGGAIVAGLSFIAPAVSLAALFGAWYFRYAHDLQLTAHMGGLVAALAGIIAANAYKLARRHVTRWWMWLPPAGVVAARLALGVQAALLVVGALLVGCLLVIISKRRGETA